MKYFIEDYVSGKRATITGDSLKEVVLKAIGWLIDNNNEADAWFNIINEGDSSIKSIEDIETI